MVERNLFTLARDLGRLPSELMSVGNTRFKVSLKAPGWLGKWLSFEGFVEDSRPPILMDEFAQLQGLYLLESEEEKEAMEAAKRGG